MINIYWIILIVILILLFIVLPLCIKIYIKLTTGIARSGTRLEGKVVIITGGNAGIGFEAAKDLAARGARVIIACRNDSRGTKAREDIVAATGNQDIHYRNLDLASLSSVREFAANFKRTENRLDILVNNAGIVDAGDVMTKDGLQMAMQVNHFAPFLLTNLLLPLLKSTAASRIVTVSSIAHRVGSIDLQNLNGEKGAEASSNIARMYGTTKLCNILMTVELKRRLEGTGVTVFSMHPGMVRTNIYEGVENIWVKIQKPFFNFFSKTSWEGAQTIIHLAVAPEVVKDNGSYFADCKVQNTSQEARDQEKAKKLWEASEIYVNLNNV